MPNIKGEDQCYPAYKPWELGPRVVVVEEKFYRILGHGRYMRAEWMDISGETGVCDRRNAPWAVKERMAFLRAQARAQRDKKTWAQRAA